ncbi:LysR family transcriptional regulator [Erysipelatoclostridium sp. An173]|uniref:LysR family transcriptional regulator n=1 Tax=Erysipelatoclostridium sp. An173 TaxID=1965571 RepID=UPI000B39523B|nr:LysR family transcriptional regulator [Erysipelatoclostridium sp. An173]OUP77975.1 LysR family transcriptional regulator [Erysipelatoclostridium sp. An173]
MEFRVLQYFLAIAREETISKAAESLHITQPPLSRQMKELEEQLGKQLFIRGNRKINLTEEGILLRQRAEEIISLVEKTESEIMHSDTTISGDIYIGSGETEGMRILAKVIDTCHKEYPKIKFHLYSGNSQDVVEKIENGLIDFGVLIEPADISKYDFIKIPVKDKWGVLMRKDSPIASLKSITADTLKKLPLICSSQEIVKNEISGWLNDDYNKLNIVATYNLIYNASLLVEEGSGYALGLDKLINTSGNSKLCFIPLEPKLEVGLTLIWKKYHLFSKATSYFLNQLRKEINKS